MLVFKQIRSLSKTLAKYAPENGRGSRSKSSINCNGFSMASAKKSPNAVWELSDEKLNGCQHYVVLQPPLIENHLMMLNLTC